MSLTAVVLFCRRFAALWTSETQTWQRVQHDDPCEAFDDYLALWHIAQAQDDKVAEQSCRAILKQIYPDVTSPQRLFLEALLEDDPHQLDMLSHNLFNMCLWEWEIVALSAH